MTDDDRIRVWESYRNNTAMHAIHENGGFLCTGKQPSPTLWSRNSYGIFIIDTAWFCKRCKAMLEVAT